MSDLDTIRIISDTFIPMMTLVMIMTGAMIVYREWRIVKERQEKRELEQVDKDGYAFIEMPDEFKSVFHDGMRGFEEFAKLKGYNVSLAIDSSTPGRVAIKFVINNNGITVSTDQVRQDLDEYIDKMKTKDDLSGMPIVNDPLEHERLVAALNMRFTLLRSEAEIQAFKAQAYERILSSMTEAVGGVGYYRGQQAPSQTLHLNVLQDGDRSMGNKYVADNSPGAAVGNDNVAGISNSQVVVGASAEQLTQQIQSLEALVNLIQGSDELEAHDKADAIRHLENAKEELNENGDPTLISRWLNKAKSVLSVANKGSQLFKTAKETWENFGMSF